MAELYFSNLFFDDLHLNLALEEVLVNAVSKGELPPFVRVWRNPISVVMGISRRVDDDLFLEHIRADNVILGRRASGGGTVYHDSGTISYSFFFTWNMLGPDASSHKIDSTTIDPFLDIVIESVGQYGLQGRRDRITDIFVRDKKICGSAQKRVKGAILHHGTLLLDVDIERMSRYLKIPPERAGIPHSDFVTSLRELGIQTDMEQFQKLLIRSLEEKGHAITEIEIQSAYPDLIDKAHDLALKVYSKEEWILRR